MFIKAYIGDITDTKTDAIVNAACLSLEGGGGVDGAVHRAAGPELLEACKALSPTHGPEDIVQLAVATFNEVPVAPTVRCPTGEARTTEGFNLSNDFIIHTVGPRYEEQGVNAPQLLRCCYANSLWEALKHDCKSIAFPAISTGIFGYPLEAATIVAVKTVMGFGSSLPKNFGIEFVCFDEANFLVYDRVINAARNGWQTHLRT